MSKLTVPVRTEVAEPAEATEGTEMTEVTEVTEVAESNEPFAELTAVANLNIATVKKGFEDQSDTLKSKMAITLYLEENMKFKPVNKFLNIKMEGQLSSQIIQVNK